MCTFNIALDDQLVDTARKSFPDEKSMTTWMQDQMNNMLRSYALASHFQKHRKTHRHDVLMGAIANTPSKDFKRMHLQEKFGL